MVIAPDLVAVPVFAVALILNEPFPVRLAGVISEMVNHDTLLVTVHVLVDVTLVTMLLASAPGCQNMLLVRDVFIEI